MVAVSRLVLSAKMAAVDQFLMLFQEVNQHFRRYEEILALVGLLYVSKTAFAVAWGVLQGLRVHVLSRLHRKDFKRFGKWAVVTGGTDGIGKAFAHELARKGLNIIIISRNIEKLEVAAEEIEAEYGVSTCIIQADFSKGREIYTSIAEQLEGKEIGVLINNVGVMYDYPSYFLDVPEQKHWDLININMASVVMMTYIILPQMVKRKRGIIVNMSSISSFNPLPLMAGYSASKIFVDWFSRALEYEYKDQGIIVQSLIPSYIATKLVRFSNFLQRPSFIVPDARTFVRSAISTIGVSNRTTGYWSHGLQYVMYEYTPVWMWFLSSWWLQKAIDTHQNEEESGGKKKQL